MAQERCPRCRGPKSCLRCPATCQLGFEVWTHWGYYSRHLKEVDLASVRQAFHDLEGGEEEYPPQATESSDES